jgi:hypothetical protein
MGTWVPDGIGADSPGTCKTAFIALKKLQDRRICYVLA